jgi:ribosome-associated toxin RatA of RatAB toxin-antitoxin module
VKFLDKSVAALVSAAALSMSLSLFATTPDCGQAAFAKGHHESKHENLSEELMHGKTYTVARVSIKASPDKVWQILSDYDNAPKVFPQLKKSKLMQDHGSSKIVKHVLAPSGLPGTYEYIVEVKESAPHSLEWHRVSGAFKQVDGYWKLEPLDGGHTTLVTYASYVDGGFLMPQPLVRRQCRIDMPEVMTTLKAQAEVHSGVQIAGRPQARGQ